MSLIALMLLGFALVPAFGLALLGWLAIEAEADTEAIETFAGFDGMHLEH